MIDKAKSRNPLLNRKQEDVKPKATASLKDISKPMTKKQKAKQKYKKFKANTTTISINWDERNILQALVFTNKASNMQGAMKLVMESYLNNLPEDERKVLDILINSIDQQKK